MYKSNNFCMICGKHLSESHSDDICSENCNDDFNDFKNNADLTSINGFCNFCGEFHELKKDSFYGVILHRHNKCYPANSYYSKSPLQIEKEREGKEELRRKQKEEEEELRRKQKEEEELRRKQKEEEELRRNLLLSNKKVYDFDSNLLFCSYCNTYSVEYSNKINEWTCNKCNRYIVMENNQSPYPFAYGMYRSLEFNFTNEDKYKIGSSWIPSW